MIRVSEDRSQAQGRWLCGLDSSEDRRTNGDGQVGVTRVRGGQSGSQMESSSGGFGTGILATTESDQRQQ